MRQPAFIRISVPPKNALPPEPDRNAAASILRLEEFRETTLRALGDLPPGDRLSRPENKVLTALPPRGSILARDLAASLNLDQGQLSRLLRRLEAEALVIRLESDDGRQWPVQLTPKGRLKRLHIKRARTHAMAALLAPLSTAQRNDLAAAADRVRSLLESCTRNSDRHAYQQPDDRKHAKDCRLPLAR